MYHCMIENAVIKIILRVLCYYVNLKAANYLPRGVVRYALIRKILQGYNVLRKELIERT